MSEYSDVGPRQELQDILGKILENPAFTVKKFSGARKECPRSFFGQLGRYFAIIDLGNLWRIKLVPFFSRRRCIGAL